MANEPTIDVMDELIALFDDKVKHDDGEYRYPYYTDKNGKGFSYPHQLEYHSSWDCLIPIIKKIREMHSDLLLTSNGGIGAYIKAAGKMNRGLISCDITKAHEGVYQFIIWLNQQKQAVDE